MKIEDEGQRARDATSTPAQPRSRKRGGAPSIPPITHPDNRLETLYERQLAEVRQQLAKVEESLRAKTREASRLEIQLAVRNQELKQSRTTPLIEYGLIQYGLNLISLILLGIGVNLITLIPP